jgi:curved DNA-binding protein CbpA
MKGKLTDHPLAELIREISTKGLSGTLRLDQDRARAAIYFKRGAVVFAASNIRNLRLGHYVSKNNLVSKKELSSFGENGSDIALAKALSANGALTQTQADGLLANLVADVLRVALLWTEGNWEFDERTHLGEDVRINIDIATLMREAAHRMPLKFVGLRFRNPGETLSRVPQMANDQVFLPTESFLLSRLDAPTRLEELVAVSGLRELDALRTIYGLVLGGVIKRQYWQPAFRESGRGGATADAEDIVPAPEEITPQSPWTLENEAADLEQFLERIDNAADHYEIMDLTPNAETDQIKEAYYAVARRYHPDRFHFKSGTPLHSRLGSAFARVTQAYETLSDAASRSTYDADLERKQQFAGSVPFKPPPTAAPEEQFDDDLTRPDSDLGQAEYNFREGFAALQQGRINAAVNHLAAAARMEPGDARYRAYYGRALAANERTRRLAENEIQAAVRIEPSNAIFRTMLAELYFNLKFHKRAQAELTRALALDPNNTSAILLQRKMDRSRSG